MKAEEWLRGQTHLVDTIEAALAKLNKELDDQYRELFGEEPTRCRRCNRIVISRNVWYSVPVGMRYSAFVPCGKGDECHSCRITSRRRAEDGGNPSLSPAEVSRLRASVNFHSHSERRYG